MPPAARRNRRRRRRYENIGQRQAGVEYNPQIAQTRRDTRGQVGSLRSMGGALQGSLTAAERGVRRAGLMSDDRQMALRELALRRADVGAGTQLQISEARREGQGQIGDLITARSQAASGIASDLLQQDRDQAQERRDDTRDRTLDLKFDLIGEVLAEKLGLGGEGEGGGLTPYQRQGNRRRDENARFFAKAGFQRLKERTGQDPGEWDDEIWTGLIGKVAEQEGVEATDAQTAVQRLRERTTGGGGFGDVARTGAQLGAAAGAIAGQNPDLPEQLRVLAQALFGQR